MPAVDTDTFVLQEFYCRTSGGGCGGYIMLPLNMALNHTVRVICPKCRHEHDRKLKDGKIIEQGRSTGAVHEICPTMAAWSPKARVDKPSLDGDAAVVPDGHGNDISLRGRWLSRFGGANK